MRRRPTAIRIKNTGQSDFIDQDGVKHINTCPTLIVPDASATREAIDIDLRLEAADNTYEHHIEAVAAYAFNRYVKPWLDKRGLALWTGNGTYLIDYQDPKKARIPGRHGGGFNMDKMPRHISEIMDSEAGGQCLGYWMQDYTGKEDKND